MNAFSMPGAESTSAALRRVEAERDDYQEHLVAMQIQRDAARAEAEQLRVEYGQARDALEREKERRPTPHLDTVKAERDLARAELARVEEAAGRDINARDQGIVDRVADLLRGRTEATQRALELAAELASARTELERLRADCDPYPNPACGKHTGNASNRCLRAPGHDGWCDDDPPVLPYRELERLRAELTNIKQERDHLVAMQHQRDLARAELTTARIELDAVRITRDGLDAKLTAARREVTALEAQLYTGRRCEKPIRLGETYVPPLPGVGLHEHVICPQPTDGGRA